MFAVKDQKGKVHFKGSDVECENHISQHHQAHERHLLGIVPLDENEKETEKETEKPKKR